jgi:K+-sensing histidine kinase KdpD
VRASKPDLRRAPPERAGRRPARATRNQARKLGLLLDANRQLAPGASLETLRSCIPAAAATLLDAESATLRLLDQDEPARPVTPDAPSERLYERVVTSGQPVLEPERRGRGDETAAERCWLGLPLLGSARLLGVLAVVGRPGQRFRPIDVELVEVFASQAATAIENALLYGEASHRREQAEAMATIARATTSSLEFHEVLGLALEKILEVMALPIGIVYLRDETVDDLRVAAHHGLSSEFIAGVDHVRLGEGALGRVAASGKPELIEDVLIHPNIVRPAVRREGFRSVAIVPLQADTRVIGAMYVCTRTVKPFNQEQTALLVAIGQQMAVAIENARLHGATVRRERELAALLRATRTVMAGLDLQVILKQIVEVAAQIAGTPYVRVLLLDDPPTAGRGEETDGQSTGTGWDDYSATVAATGRPMFVEDVRGVAGSAPPELPAGGGPVAYLGLPIKGRERVLGVLVFNTTSPDQYIAAELEYLSSFADQMALAIENARLFEQVAVVEAMGELARLKTEFLSTVSHELRTPLSLILGYAELLMHRAPRLSSNQVIDMAGEIHAGSLTMARLVDDLLDFTRLEQGKIRFHPKRLPLAELLGRLVEPFRLQPGGGRITLDLTFGPEANVDPERFAQVINNLLTNALRYAPDGPIRVALREQPGDPAADSTAPGAGAVLLVEVSDQGPGIPQEEQGRIWEKFYRGTGALLSPTRGNGLGLAVVKHLVELHGGVVGLRSTPGRGSTFWFSLPRAGEALPDRPELLQRLEPLTLIGADQRPMIVA